MSIISPETSPLFIDKLSMTLDITEHQHQTVVKNFNNYLAEMYGGGLYQGKLYHLSKKLYLEGEIVILQCMPKAQNCSFFRIEWNPAKLETAEVADIVNLILPDGYHDLIHYGRITRIDITTDVKNLKMDELLFRYPGMAIGYNYLKTGIIQTAYLGSKGGANQFKFYDKVKQVKDNNATKPKQYKEALPDHPTTRIEWEYRPQKVCTFATINDTCKPIYKKLWCGMVANLPVPPTTDFEGHINAVMRLSRYKALSQALYAIPKFRRLEVRAYIENNSHTSWWNPESLWGTFFEAIEHILNPPPNKWVVNQ